MVGGYLYDYGMAEGYGRPYASGVNPAGAIQLDKNEYQSHSFNGNAMFEATFFERLQRNGKLWIAISWYKKQ